MPTSEILFAFFVAIGMYCIARARDGSTSYAAFAGIVMAISAGVRLEAWALMPLFGVILWRDRKALLWYALCAGGFSLLWVISGITHGLLPTEYLAATKSWDQQIEGWNEGLNFGEVLRRIFYYPYVVFFALTAPIAVLCILGANVTWKDRIQRIWLLPFSALLLMFMQQAARGVGGTKARYSLLLGLLFLPFSAAAIETLKQKRWLKTLALVCIVLMVPLSYLRVIWFRTLGPEISNPFPADIQAIPRIQKEPVEIARIARENITAKDDGFVLDFFGKDFYPWNDTYAVALLSRQHRSNIFFMPGGRHQLLDEGSLKEFLVQHQRGVLLYERESRMIQLMHAARDTKARIGNCDLLLRPVRTVKSITIYRYEMR
jgi:hypothetical protein